MPRKTPRNSLATPVLAGIEVRSPGGNIPHIPIRRQQPRTQVETNTASVLCITALLLLHHWQWRLPPKQLERLVLLLSRKSAVLASESLSCWGTSRPQPTPMLRWALRNNLLLQDSLRLVLTASAMPELWPRPISTASPSPTATSHGKWPSFTDTDLSGLPLELLGGGTTQRRPCCCGRSGTWSGDAGTPL